MKKAILLILVFYFLILLQTGFAPHFRVFGLVPNLVLGAVVLLNLFEKQEEKFGLLAAVLGGFLMDIFSAHFFGFYAGSYLVIAVFLKYFVRQYVKLPAFR